MSVDQYSVEITIDDPINNSDVIYSNSSLSVAAIEVEIDESIQMIENVGSSISSVVELTLDSMLEESIVYETNLLVEIGIDVQSYGIVAPESPLITGVGIDDSKTNLNQTWSSEKISNLIDSVESGEIHTEDLWIAINQNTLDITKKVSYVPQVLTNEEKQIVCDNIGIGDISKDLIAIYRAARGVLD